MNAPRPTAGGGVSDTDLMLIVLGLVLFGGPIAAAALGYWHTVVTWLVDHHVLLAGAARPLLPIPGFAGAGVDLARLFVVAAALAVLVIAVVHAIRSRRTKDL